MNAIPSKAIPDHLTVVLTLAHVLQRLENSPGPVGAEQYRSVVAHLSEVLAQVAPSPQFQALLEAYPAAAEVYENLNYRHAGLCRSPLEWSLAAEMSAREAIQRASRRG